MEETWADELNNPSDVDVSILDREISHQDLQPFLQAPDADHYFTGADHDHMTQTLEEAGAGSELEYNTLIYNGLNGVSCSDDYGGREHGMSEVSEQNLLGHHEDQDEETPDFPGPLLKQKMKAKGELQSRNRTSNWTEVQTEYLVDCKKAVNIAKEHGLRFAKGKDASNDWNKISQKFSARFAAEPDNFKTSKQCRLRWDTLLKAFKKIKAHCISSGIEHTELNKEDLLKLELATTLRTDWYDTIDKFCPPRSKKGKLQKSFALNSNPGRADHKGSANLSTENAPASPPHIEVQTPGKERSKQIAIPRFKELPNLTKCILLDFVFHDFNQYDVMEVCRWLALVHDEREDRILACVFQLLDVNLIRPKYTHGVYSSLIKFERMRFYHKFADRVLKHNPNLRIHLNLRHIGDDVFMTTTQHDGLRILDFHKCDQLNIMDLKHVPNLISLTFNFCPNLAKVFGWEELTKLDRLDVTYCPKLNPTTKNLKALKHINMSSKKLDGSTSTIIEAPHDFDTRTMTRMGEYLDLNNLRALENLGICYCNKLKMVDDSFGGLLALIKCSFRGCHDLHNLPDMGNLKMLKYLDIQDTKIQSIPGLEKLNNLETLNCCDSEVKSLPDLRHMPRLREVQPKSILKWEISSPIDSQSSLEKFTFIDDDGNPDCQENDAYKDDTYTDWSD